MLAARAVLAAALVARAHAGIGGSAVTLVTCDPASAYQRWAVADAKLKLTGDANPLWQSSWCLSTSTGIGSLAAAPGSGLYASPCGGALALALNASAPRTALALTGAGAGLCVTAARGALPFAQLSLEACAAGADAQAFAVDAAAGAVVHVASGLCADAGTRAKACEAGSLGAGLPFCDAALPVDARVADLVGRLSLDEKAAMLATASGGAPRVGVAAAQWWQEALHGLANNVGVSFNAPTPYSTSFPQPITSSCAFNRSLWRATGAAISDEVRAFANAGHSGLTLWSPNM